MYLLTATLLNAHAAAGDTWMHVHEDSGLFLQKRWKFMLWSGRAGVKIFHITWACCYSQVKSYCSNNTSGCELQWHCHALRRRETCHWKLLYCHWGWHTTIAMKNPFWTFTCAADSQQQTHTHLHTFIFIIFCFSNSCLVSGAVLLVQSETPTAHYTKQLLLLSKFISLLFMHDVLIASQWTNYSIRSALHLS